MIKRNQWDHWMGWLAVATATLFLSACHNQKSKVIGSGSFEATEVLVSSEVNGRVLEWNIEEGSTIQQGEQVGLVDTTQLFLQREALLRSGKGVRANQPNIATQTKALEVKLEELQSNRNRTARLLKSGVATQKQLDDLDSGIAAVESQLSAARSTLSNQSSQITAQSSAIDIQVAQVDDLIERSKITAPISGTVLANYIHRGELAGQGRPLFRVGNLETLFLRAYVQNNRLGTLHLGDEVKVQVDGENGEKRSYSGTISWISSRAEFTPKTVQTDDERSNLVYAIKVRVPNSDGTLRIGMYGEVVR
ncbi:HlyD family secretion protein [Porphyromonas somerae]|uniref:HlyD family secretion protein n=1 Tax=Porphyromonas somerae TaxID=322095 RepID=UPI002A83A8A8|nr:HlyD family efflux transporter periplasmic adaptor subunit [Porphyromonas somerae]MDY3884017.1 HlyD family efflux transporter periplasmic adaptor subunit [Porphyromonas somerae]